MSDWKLTDYTEMHYIADRSRKFYRVIVLANNPCCEYRVVTQWGRIGTEGQHRVEVFNSDGAANGWAWDKQNEKSRKGYYTVSQNPNDCDFAHALEMAAIGAAGTVTPARRQEEQPQTSVSDDIVRLLDEVIALNEGDSVPQSKATELMDRYTELVAAAEAEQQKQASTATALDMALTAVMSMAGRVKS